jgi:hypothetical protein
MYVVRKECAVIKCGCAPEVHHMRQFPHEVVSYVHKVFVIRASGMQRTYRTVRLWGRCEDDGWSAVRVIVRGHEVTANLEYLTGSYDPSM